MSQAERALGITAGVRDAGGEQTHTRVTRRLRPFRLEVLSVAREDEEDTLVVRTNDQRRIVATAFEDLSIDEEAAVPSQRFSYARDDFEAGARESKAPLHSGTRPVARPAPISEVPPTSPSAGSIPSFPSVPAFADAQPADDAPPSSGLSGLISTAPKLSAALSYAAISDPSALMAPELLRTGSSIGILRSTLRPETKRAIRASREAARRARAAATWMRVVVVGIWGTAVVLAVLLALFARMGS